MRLRQLVSTTLVLYADLSLRSGFRKCLERDRSLWKLVAETVQVCVYRIKKRNDVFNQFTQGRLTSFTDQIRSDRRLSSDSAHFWMKGIKCLNSDGSPLKSHC